MNSASLLRSRGSKSSLQLVCLYAEKQSACLLKILFSLNLPVGRDYFSLFAVQMNLHVSVSAGMDCMHEKVVGVDFFCQWGRFKMQSMKDTEGKSAAVIDTCDLSEIDKFWIQRRIALNPWPFCHLYCISCETGLCCQWKCVFIHQ